MIRKILKGISLTAAMFVFQACYGTMGDYYDPVYEITLRVTDAKDGKPLEGVAVQGLALADDSTATGDWRLIGYTDSNGCATAWLSESLTQFNLQVEDGSYAPADTLVNLAEAPDTVHIALHHAPHAV